MFRLPVSGRSSSRPGVPSRSRIAFRRSSRVAGLLLAALASLAPCPLPAITITEIMYHPSAAQEAEVGGANLEWLEIYNEEPTVVNLAGYYFSEGIQFIFPFDVYLEGRSYLVICADEAAVRAKYGITNTIGNFAGRLDNNGERLTLNIYGGGPDVSVRYSDRDQWPKAADGTGHSLVLLDPYEDPDDNDNWVKSSAIGGTPGFENFGEPRVIETEIFPEDSVWRYRKNTTPYPEDWFLPEFDDSDWLSGPTGIGYGDGDDRTELSDMSNGYFSFAARKTIELTQDDLDSFDDLYFQIDFDDGFVAYLNGTEFARASMGAPGAPFAHDTTASPPHEANGFEAFAVSSSLLRTGTNVFAVAVHNASFGSSDSSFIPRLVSSRTDQPDGSGPPVPVVINECLLRTSGEGWIELYNRSSRPFDLSGYHLSDNSDLLSKYRIPDGTAIAGNGFLVVTASETGFDFSGIELAVFLTRPGLDEVVAAAHFERFAGRVPPLDEMSDALYPDGGDRFFVSVTPTPGATNAVELVEDVVIHEIMYNPPRERPYLSFVELYNRGVADRDVSGFQFTRGIDFTMPPGTVIPRGGYLVIAENPLALETAHGISGVVGPYAGALARSGELIRLVDTLGNIVDEVRYHDGGGWSEWADGGGSSLELIDPDQDNSVASAWDASDESSKSDWELIEYMVPYTTQQESEFQIRMLAEAEILVDDIHVTLGATEYIPNGSFEANTSGWIIEGTHIQSHRTTEDSYAGDACLKVVATSDGDTRVNRIETETSPRMGNGTYTVRLAARWLRGGNLLYLSCFRQLPQCQHTHWLTLPPNPGTPGAPNSIGLQNLGPVISEVEHRPAVPGNGEQVLIRARVTDADGVARVSAVYRASTGAAGAAPLLDDGQSGDGAAADSIFAGSIPGFGLNVKVNFHIEAEDELGAVRREPRDAPARTHVYEHSSPLAARSFLYRLVHDGPTWNELNTRRLHSNELLDATFIFNEEKVFYNVGTRYRGSPWNRPGNPRMYRVQFQKDKPYRGRGKINLSRYGTAQNEKAAGYIVWRNSTPSTTSPYSRAAWARVRTTAGTFTMESIDPPGRDYLDLWFPSDADGYLMKITGRQIFDDFGNHLSNFIQWGSYGNRGADKTAYRWNFNPRTRELEDNFEPLTALMRAMNASTTALDEDLEDIMDVEQFLRVYAARCAHDDWDTIAIGNGQNAYIYYAPIEGRWKLLPWDMDHTWGNASARTMPDADASMARILLRPKYRRMYAGIIHEMLNGRGDLPGHWTPEELAVKFLDRNSAVVGADGVGGSGGIRNFMNARRSALASLIPARVSFAILTNGGKDFVVDSSRTTIEGNAWVDVHTILVSGERVPFTWPTITRWRAEVELAAGENPLEFLAIDPVGNIVGATSIHVTSTVGWAPPQVTAVDPAAALPRERITIHGTEFHEGIAVFFGGVPSPSVEFDDADPSSLSAEVPLMPDGSIDLVVQNVDERSSEPMAFTVLPLPPHFVRGDANLDKTIDVSDGVRIIRHLFAGAVAPCLDAADADDDETVTVTDAVRVLAFIYQQGTPPAGPYPDPGTDPTTSGGLDCEAGIDLFSE